MNSSVTEISLDMHRGGTDNLISPGNLSFFPHKQSLNRSIPTLASKPDRVCGRGLVKWGVETLNGFFNDFSSRSLSSSDTARAPNCPDARENRIPYPL